MNRPAFSLTNLLLLGILATGILLSFSILWKTHSSNESFGFPLDDSWIHLQFARNLVEHGSFSYYKSEMVTSGSTSPLYTLLLAVGMVFVGNEMILSYTLGVLFLVLASLCFHRLIVEHFGDEKIFALAGVLLLLLEPRLQWSALSGMETTLFIFLLLATSLMFVRKDRYLTGLFSGLLIWTRPEALVFIGVLVMQWWYDEKLVGHGRKKAKASEPKPTQDWFKGAMVVFVLLLAGYFLFNLALSGTFLPNTFAAKTKYYSTGGENYGSQAIGFLGGGHLLVFWVFSGIGAVSVIVNVLNRKREPLMACLLWVTGMVVAFWLFLPYLYQEGRYLMPVIPFFLILGVRGLRDLFQISVRTIHLFKNRSLPVIVQAVVLLFFATQFCIGSWTKGQQYAEDCRYIADRQVRAARWIREHLPETALVATHDIGAIAYYSGRRIVDMVGLVSPEMIEQLGNLTGLREQLGAHGVTHVAVLRSWFEVDNQEALFQTDERQPEVMEVFSFEKDRTHFVPGGVAELRTLGWRALNAGNAQQAEVFLRQAMQMDPLSARTRYLLGMFYLKNNKMREAEREIQRALDFHPRFSEARLARAEISMRRGDTTSVRIELNGIIQDKPLFAPAYLALSAFYGAVKADSTRASAYRKRFDELSGSNAQ